MFLGMFNVTSKLMIIFYIIVLYYILVLQGSVNFKFGVLYCKEGQTADDEMYGNGMCKKILIITLCIIHKFIVL